MKLALGKIVVILGLAAGTASTVGCSTGASEPPSAKEPSPSGSDETGTVEMGLRIGRTSQINTLSYALTGPDGFQASGTLNVRSEREAEGTIPSVPVGSPYTLTLNAASTDHNTTCTGTANNLAVTCPGTGERDENVVKLTCTRNHVGREWGDRDWRSNAKTFFLTAAIDLACEKPDACVRETQAQACGSNTCGTAPDGCGGTVSCGECPLQNVCGAGTCVCVPKTFVQACGNSNCGTAPDACGGNVACGTCAAPGSCSGNPGVCGCVPLRPAEACGTSVCGVAPDGCGGTVSCGTCPSGTCTIPDGGTAGTCSGCTPLCSEKQCGPDGCGGTCGTCPTGQGCSFSSPGTCTACGVCPGGQTCGQAEDVCFNLISCGTCAAGQVCDFGANPAQCCVQQPTSVTCAGKNCGAVFDNCGIQVSCGTCPAGSTCSDPGSGGVCNTCTPLTMAQACGSNTCGSVADGCGGTISCGTCPTGLACSSTTGPGICNCTPQNACAGKACGPAVDNCGSAVSCGICPPGQVCGGDDQCHIVENPCGIASDTQTCLGAQGSNCFSCVQDNGCLDPAQFGGSCEDVSGTSTKFSGTLPDGNTCTQVLASTPENETQVCLQTLDSIFVSQCAVTLQETPCLCGATDPTACLAGTATPTGPIYDLYACDFNTISSPGIQNTFTIPSYGAGQANALIQCAASFGCNSCFGQ